jgi:hypothetical protein
MLAPSLLLSERLYILKILRGLVVGVFSLWPFSTTISPADALSAIQRIVPFILIISKAFGLIVSLLLPDFIARRASDVANRIFIVFFALDAVSLIRDFTGCFSIAGWMHRLSLLPAAIEAVMLWLLFRPEAKAWIAGPSRPPRYFRDAFS